MSHLKKRVLLITGAAGGFGRIVACEAAKRGAKVVACDVNVDELNETVNMIQNEGGTGIAVKADVTKAEDMANAVHSAVDAFDRVDVLVNNAGTMPLAYFSDHAEALEAWSRCIDINFKGVLNGISAAYDQMIEQGAGHIVNISSIYSNHAVKGAAVYGATKAAINYLGEALRLESHGKIKVTTVKPTGIPTTGLNKGMVNPQAGLDSMGVNAPTVLKQMDAMTAGTASDALLDSDNIEYALLSPELMSEQILYAIDQPWGVSISDVTVRASGDMFIM